MPFPTRLCWRIVLVCKVSCWVLSTNFWAWGLRSWGSDCWVIPCDGLFLSHFFAWRSVPCENFTLRFGPKDFGFFRKNRVGFRRLAVLEYANSTCLEFFNKAIETLPPFFFGRLFGWLPASLCIKEHFVHRICSPIRLCNSDTLEDAMNHMKKSCISPLL